MSLDNFQLPPFLIQELYKDSLISSVDEQIKPVSLKGPECNFLGKNNQQILLLVNEENAVYLEDQHLNLLVGILKACDLSLADVAIVNIHQNMEIGSEGLLAQFQPQILLFFGVEPELLGFPLKFPHFQLQRYNNQTYLVAPSLATLSADIEEKKKLWNALQQLFPKK